MDINLRIVMVDSEALLFLTIACGNIGLQKKNAKNFYPNIQLTASGYQKCC